MKKIIGFFMVMIVAASLAIAQDAKSKKTAKEYIADLSSATDDKTLIEAAQWLGSNGEKDAIPSLSNLVRPSSGKSEAVKIEAAVALGLIGEESGVDALHEALLNDSSPQVRYAAILATMRIGSKKSIDVYRQLKEKETDEYITDLLAKLEEAAKGK